MHQIRQIFELRQQQVGLRKIERLTGFSRNAVGDYVGWATATIRPGSEIVFIFEDDLY